LVATVRQGHKELASAVFFHFNQETIYKFGASDYAFQRLRPNNLLMWEAIRRYASVGYSRMHLGRTSMHRNGLRRFKLGLGAREERLEYRKYDFAKEALVGQVDRAEGWANPIFRRLPQPLLRLAGELLYPHLS
jgi:lipid II:glycine glycyltransferase (peptidoglycan interpeptide bridge formation enzyme)